MHFCVSYFGGIMYNGNETSVTNYDMGKGRENNETQNKNPAACSSDRSTLQLYADDRTKKKENNTIPKDASLICEETVSPNKDYITDEKDLVNYTVRVYQEKNNDIIVYAESNSPLFDEAQYIVTCDHAITADDVHIKWTTLMGSTEASEKDEIGLAHVSISKDGEVFNEKTISFVAKAVNAVTDVIG